MVRLGSTIHLPLESNDRIINPMSMLLIAEQKVLAHSYQTTLIHVRYSANIQINSEEYVITTTNEMMLQ